MSEYTPYVAGVVSVWEFGRWHLKNVLKDLTPEQLAKVPAGLTNSIATLVVHIAATELSIASQIKGEPLSDELRREYLLDQPHSPLPAPAGETVESLYAKLDKAGAYLTQVLKSLTEADLKREVSFFRGPAPITKPLSLLPHHQAEPVGQIIMIKKLI